MTVSTQDGRSGAAAATAKPGLLRSFGDALLAWLPFQVVGVMTPLNIYLSNQLDFEDDPTILMPFFWAAVLFLALFLGLSLLRRGWIPKVANALFFYGLFLVLSDALVPLQWGLMDGTEELREVGHSVAIQTALAIGLGLAWYLLPREAARSFGLPLVLVFTAWQIALIAQLAAKGPDRALALATPAAPVSGPSERLPNIYQIVFDGYSSLLFLKAAEENGVLDDLQGFTFFRRNMSNYVVTDASVPSFITGRLFKGGSFKDFQLEANSGGMRKQLDDLGYDVSIYAPDTSRFWMYRGATHVYTSKDVSVGSRRWQRLAQTTFVRVAPEILRHEALFATDFILYGEKASYWTYRRQSVPLMERLLAEEADRTDSGNYVYAHLILPHYPYVWDGECRQSKRTGFVDQTTCATRLIKDFIGKINELGRYDDSIIILQSDHGTSGVDEEPVFPVPMLKAGRQESEEFFDRLHALLLIKPPNAGAVPLRVSEDITQLVDIPATVYDLLNVAPPPTDGYSVFQLDDVGDREISVFSGIKSNFGQSLDTLFRTAHASVGHLGYNPDRGWTVHPEIEATHEGW